MHELAEHLKISEEEVLEGLESANAYSTLSLDVPDTDDESPAVADTLGAEDDALEGVEYRESLKPLLEQLPPREKKILLLRFFGNMTQSQIAQEVGISQMHVSRLLARTLAQLRDRLLRRGVSSRLTPAGGRPPSAGPHEATRRGRSAGAGSARRPMPSASVAVGFTRQASTARPRRPAPPRRRSARRRPGAWCQATGRARSWTISAGPRLQRRSSQQPARGGQRQRGRARSTVTRRASAACACRRLSR